MQNNCKILINGQLHLCGCPIIFYIYILVMADNYLENHYDSYLSKKEKWERAMKNGRLKVRKIKKQIDKH